MRFRSAVLLGSFGLTLGVAAGSGSAVAQERPAAPRVRVTAPAQGATVTSYPVLIRGVVEPPDPDVRVTVNARAAVVVQGGEWALPRGFPPGTYDLLIEARARGQVVSRTDHRITVRDPPPGEKPVLIATGPVALRRFEGQWTLGIAPFQWTFRLDAETGVTGGRLDPEGTGVKLLELQPGDAYTHAFGSPGLYSPTFRYTDRTGRAVTQQGLIVVFDRAWLEPILQRRWEEFLAALGQDPESATRLVEATRRRYFSVMLEALQGPGQDPGKWARLMAGLGPLVLESVGGRVATCKFKGNPKGPGIDFVLDPDDGRWYYYFQ